MREFKQFEQWAKDIVGVYESKSVIQEDDVGREFQHIEDLTYIHGPEGALRAIERLAQIVQDSSHLEVKWDGSPAIIFGRNDKGQFHLGDKYAKEYITSPKALYAYVTRKGASESRVEFANVMMSLFKYYQAATPKNYRGFLECGLMYPTSQQPKPQEVKGVYSFKPNTVVYHVQANSALGQRIAGSVTAAAATGFFQDLPGLGGQREAVGEHYLPIQSEQVIIIPPTFTNTQAKIPQQHLRSLAAYVRKNARAITNFITPDQEWIDTFKKNPAKAGSEWRAMIYKYVNTQVDNPAALQNLGDNMTTWAQTDPILKSAGRREIAINKIDKDRAGRDATFAVVRGIMQIKNEILTQIEKPTLGQLGISATLPTGQDSGEGFVSDPHGGRNPLKLVNRGGFTAANRAQGAIGAARKSELGSKAKEGIKEAVENKTAVVGWGRGMGHLGHMYLAESVIYYAKEVGGTPFFFVSETVGPDDPLTPGEKIEIYQTVFPKFKHIFKTGKNPVEILKKLHDSGYTDCVFIVGEDQKQAFQFLTRATKGTGELPVPFRTIQVISRQDTGSKTSNLAGPRATPMREILKSPKASYEQKYKVWRKAMPGALSDEQVKHYMTIAAERMGFPLEELNEADNPNFFGGSSASPIPGTPADLASTKPTKRQMRIAAINAKNTEKFMGRRR